MSEHVRDQPATASPDPERIDTEPGTNRYLALLGRASGVRHIGLVLALAILCVVGAATSSEFWEVSNLLLILKLASVIGVVTVGMTFVIIGGGIDLSVGSIVALASVWATTLQTQSYGAGVMVFTALAVGAATGLVNGVLIAYGRLVPFIVTLAMLAGADGLAQQISDRRTQINQVESINDLGRNEFLGVPLIVYVFAAVVLAGWVLLNRTTFGRRTFAVGGNSEAARLAGINVRWHIMLLYVLSGLCCGIAAIMLVARTESGTSTHGDLYELDAIAAVIIGGTLLIGGRGSLVGSILGVLVFTVITDIFVLNFLATEVQNIAKGLIIIAAVLLQRRSQEAVP